MNTPRSAAQQHILRSQNIIQDVASRLASTVNQEQQRQEQRHEELAELSLMLQQLRQRSKLRQSQGQVPLPDAAALEEQAAVAASPEQPKPKDASAPKTRKQAVPDVLRRARSTTGTVDEQEPTRGAALLLAASPGQSSGGRDRSVLEDANTLFTRFHQELEDELTQLAEQAHHAKFTASVVQAQLGALRTLCSPTLEGEDTLSLPDTSPLVQLSQRLLLEATAGVTGTDTAQAGQRPHPTTQAPFQATTTAPKVTVAQQQPQPQPQVSPQRVVRERTGLVQRLADLLSDPGSGAGSPVRPGDRPEFEALGPDTLLFGNPQPAISDPGTGRHGVQNAAQHGVQQGSDAEPAKQFMQPTARSAQKPASKQTEGTHASETPAVQQDVQAADAVAVGDKEEMVPMRDLGALLNLRDEANSSPPLGPVAIPHDPFISLGSGPSPDTPVRPRHAKSEAARLAHLRTLHPPTLTPARTPTPALHTDPRLTSVESHVDGLVLSLHAAQLAAAAAQLAEVPADDTGGGAPPSRSRARKRAKRASVRRSMSCGDLAAAKLQGMAQGGAGVGGGGGRPQVPVRSSQQQVPTENATLPVVPVTRMSVVCQQASTQVDLWELLPEPKSGESSSAVVHALRLRLTRTQDELDQALRQLDDERSAHITTQTSLTQARQEIRAMKADENLSASGMGSQRTHTHTPAAAKHTTPGLPSMTPKRVSIAGLEAIVDEATADLERLEESITRCAARLAALQAEGAQAAEELRGARRQKGDAESATEVARQTEQELQASIAESQKCLVALRTEQHSAEAQLAQLHTDLQRTQAEVAALQHKYQSVQREAQSAEARLASAQQEWSEVEKRLSKGRLQLNDAEAARAQVDRDVKGMQATLDKLRAEFASLESQLSETRSALASDTQSLSTLRGERTAVETELQQLRADLTQATTQRDTLTEQQTQAETHLDSLKKELSSVSEAVREGQEHLRQLFNQRHESTQELEFCQKRLAKCKRELQEHLAKLEAQQVAETESQQRADEATKRAADVEQQLSRLQAQLAAAERQLQEAALAKQMQTPEMPDSMAGWARGLVLDSTLHTPALNVGTSAMDNKATGSLAVWQHEVERLQRALQAAESQRRLAEERAAEAEAQLHATRSAHAALDRQMRAHTGLDTPHTPGHLHTLRTQIATLEADLEATQRLATQYKSRAAAASQEVAALEESLLSERATVNRLRKQLQDARDESVRSVAGDVYTPGGAGAAPATNARLARRLAEEEVEEAKVHLKRLQKQTEAQAAAHSELVQERRALEQRCSELREQLDAAAADQETARHQLSSARQALQRLQQQQRDAGEELRQKEEQLETLQARSAAEQQRLTRARAAAQEAEATVAELQHVRDELTASVSRLQSQLHTLQATPAPAAAAVAAPAAAETRAAAKATRSVAVQATCATHSRAVQCVAARRSQAVQACKSRDDTASVSVQTAATEPEVPREAQLQAEQQQAKLQEAQQQAEQLQKLTAELQQRLAASQAEAAGSQQRLAAADQQLADCRQQVASLEQAAAAQQDAVGTLRGELAAAREQAARAQRDKDTHVIEMTRVQLELSQAQDALAAARREVSGQQHAAGQLAADQQALQQCQADLAAARTQLREAAAQQVRLAAAERELAELRPQLTALHGLVQDADEQQSEQDALNLAAAEQLQAAQVQLAQTMEDLAALELECAGLRQQLAVKAAEQAAAATRPKFSAACQTEAAKAVCEAACQTAQPTVAVHQDGGCQTEESQATNEASHMSPDTAASLSAASSLLDAMRDEAERLESVRQELQRDLPKLHADKALLTEEVRHLRGRRDSVKQQLQTLAEHLDAQRATQASLGAQATTAATDELARLTDKVSSLEESLHQQRIEEIRVKADCDNLKSRLTQALGQVDLLQARLETSEASRRAAELLAAQQQQAASHADARRASAESALAAADAQVAALQEDAVSTGALQAGLTAALSECEELRGRVAVLMVSLTQLEELQQRVARQEQQLTLANRQTTSLTDQLTTALADLATSNTSLTAARSQVTLLTDQVSHLTQSLSEAHTDLRARAADVEAAQRRIEQLEGVLDEAQAMLAEPEEPPSDLQVALNAERARCEALRAELETLRGELEGVCGERGAEAQRVAELGGVLASERARADRVQLEADALRQRVEDLSAALDHARGVSAAVVGGVVNAREGEREGVRLDRALHAMAGTCAAVAFAAGQQHSRQAAAAAGVAQLALEVQRAERACALLDAQVHNLQCQAAADRQRALQWQEHSARERSMRQTAETIVSQLTTQLRGFEAEHSQQLATLQQQINALRLELDARSVEPAKLIASPCSTQSTQTEAAVTGITRPGAHADVACQTGTAGDRALGVGHADVASQTFGTEGADSAVSPSKALQAAGDTGIGLPGLGGLQDQIQAAQGRLAALRVQEESVARRVKDASSRESQAAADCQELSSLSQQMRETWRNELSDLSQCIRHTHQQCAQHCSDLHAECTRLQQRHTALLHDTQDATQTLQQTLHKLRTAASVHKALAALGHAAVQLRQRSAVLGITNGMGGADGAQVGVGVAMPVSGTAGREGTATAALLLRGCEDAARAARDARDAVDAWLWRDRAAAVKPPATRADAACQTHTDASTRPSSRDLLNIHSMPARSGSQATQRVSDLVTALSAACGELEPLLQRQRQAVEVSSAALIGLFNQTKKLYLHCQVQGKVASNSNLAPATHTPTIQAHHNQATSTATNNSHTTGVWQDVGAQLLRLLKQSAVAVKRCQSAAAAGTAAGEPAAAAAAGASRRTTAESTAVAAMGDEMAHQFSHVLSLVNALGRALDTAPHIRGQVSPRESYHDPFQGRNTQHVGNGASTASSGSPYEGASPLSSVALPGGRSRSRTPDAVRPRQSMLSPSLGRDSFSPSPLQPHPWQHRQQHTAATARPVLPGALSTYGVGGATGLFRAGLGNGVGGGVQEGGIGTQGSGVQQGVGSGVQGGGAGRVVTAAEIDKALKTLGLPDTCGYLAAAPNTASHTTSNAATILTHPMSTPAAAATPAAAPRPTTTTPHTPLNAVVKQAASTAHAATPAMGSLSVSQGGGSGQHMGQQGTGVGAANESGQSSSVGGQRGVSGKESTAASLLERVRVMRATLQDSAVAASQPSTPSVRTQQTTHKP